MYQDLPYESQLELKSDYLKECLEKIGGFREYSFEGIAGSSRLYFYRNKMEFSFSHSAWRSSSLPHSNSEKFALGLHVRGEYDKVVDIDECMLQSPMSNAILKEVKDFMLDNDLIPYNIRSQKGLLRFLVIREGKNTGEIMVNIVTSENSPELIKPLAEKLALSFPAVKSFLNTVNPGKANIAPGELVEILYGTNFINERICGLNFEVYPFTFLQTNTHQAENLYRTVLEFAALKGDEVVYDLYCGTGTISLLFSRYCGEVYGFEIGREAVESAERNAEINGSPNCKFINIDVKDIFRNDSLMLENLPDPQIVILDPPRAGLHKKVIRGILNLMVPKIIYISCNPITFSKDLRELCSEKYEIERIKALDMFPHTKHVEAVAKLRTAADTV